ncbi:MAG: LysR family transcriptional regulator [Oscillospiraceae bacterium]|jgi:DNA-binding transcriptional LysR family regulator|nr:LysR family transcriptional regulator [Oscillospiraceae bacterium]
MNFNHLNEFNVLAECSSFREASSKLGVSPALLSAHISALEKSLGAVLLNRNAHSCSLTAEGRRFHSDALTISENYAQIRKRIDAVGDNSNSSLTMAISGVAMPARLGPYLDEVNRREPNIRLGLLDDSRHDIENSLRRGEVDLFFSYCSDDAEYNGIEKELVYTTRLIALAPSNHRLARRGSITLKELEGETIIHYPLTAEPAMRDCEIALLKKHNISYSVYDEPTSTSKYLVLVPIGKGIALCPWVMRDSIPPNTSALNISDADASVSMYMFYVKSSANPSLAGFLSGFQNFETMR